jgi:hypothetical protein
MATLDEIAGDIGAGPQFEDEASTESSPGEIEDRVDSIFGQEEKPAEVEHPVQKVEPTAEGKPEGQPEDFAVASQKAFLNDDGSLNSDKLTTQFLERGKSYLQLMQHPAEEVQNAKADDFPDPKSKYYESVENLVGNLPDLLAKDRQAGYTPEQTLQRLINTFSGLTGDRDTALAVAKEREGLTKEFRQELESVRMQRVQAQADKNFSEISEGLDNLIPGHTASQTLNKLLLSPEYGGQMVDAFFKRDNPDFQKWSEIRRR